MISALDSSVVLDVVLDDPKFMRDSLKAIRTAQSLGKTTISPIVFAEIRSVYKTDEQLLTLLSETDIEFDQIDQQSACLAGDLWRTYRKAGGSRDRIMADFMIGAHALKRADRLITRDRGFYREYFKDLNVVDPTQ